MNVVLVACRAACVCAALGLAVPAAAQPDPGTGRSRAEPRGPQASSGMVVLSPVNGTSGPGAIEWACSAGAAGSLRSAVELGSPGRTGAAQPVVWRFDAGGEDTTFLAGLDGTTRWFVREADVARFTLLASSSAGLTVHVPAGPAAGAGTEYRYDLGGIRDALDGLPCARTSVLLERVARDARPGAAPVPRMSPLREGTYELSAVEELPRVANTAEFVREIARSYPRLLRNAGVPGTATVRLRVREDGSVDPESIRVTGSSDERFNEPGIRAARVLRFRPAKVGGRPVPVWVEMPMRWTPD